jgi:Na+-translocating ferredoxin:NAD+ oxidoreductase RnfE subunit
MLFSTKHLTIQTGFPTKLVRKLWSAIISYCRRNYPGVTNRLPITIHMIAMVISDHGVLINQCDTR